MYMMFFGFILGCANNSTKHGLALCGHVRVGRSLSLVSFIDNLLSKTFSCHEHVWISLPTGRTRHRLHPFMKALSHLANECHTHGKQIIVMAMQPNRWNKRKEVAYYGTVPWERWLKQHCIKRSIHCMCAYGLRHEGKAVHQKFFFYTSFHSVCDRVCSWHEVRDDAKSTCEAHHHVTFVARWCADWITHGAMRVSSSFLGVDHRNLSVTDIGNALPTVPETGSQQTPDSGMSMESSCPPEDPASFPTDAKERRRKREKAAKEQGKELVVKHKTKHVESHYDDCGEDLSGIIGKQSLDQAANFTWLSVVYIDPDYEEEFDDVGLLDNSLSFYFWGRHEHLYSNLQQIIASNMQELALIANTKGECVDLIEICGGQARASQVGVRRKLAVCPNF